MNVLVLAPDPGGRGGIEYASRALIRALSDLYGSEHVGLVPVWGSERLKDLPCRVFGRAPIRAGEHHRVAFPNKIAFAAAALSAALRWRRDVTVVSCHPSLAPVAWACGLFAGGRYSVWCHGTEVWFRLSSAVRFALRRAGAIFSPSSYTARRVEEVARLPKGTVRVIPHPLSKDFAEIVDHSSPERTAGRYLLSVARLDASERHKGIDHVISALPRVHETVPGIRYMIIGDGEDRHRLELLASRVGVADEVDFKGALTTEETAACYLGCELFVMPSKQEGYGIVYMEAALCGKPSIAGNHGGAPEAVVEGETGFTVTFGDIEGLARSLVRLLEDRRLRESMGNAARVRVLERHGFEGFRENVRSLTHALEAD